MKKLVVLRLDDNETVIGSVTQKSDGSIVVQGVEQKIEQELKEKIAQLTSQSLGLRTGQTSKMENGSTRHSTLIKKLIPSDKDYLRALADTINRHKITISGFLVRSFVVEE